MYCTSLRTKRGISIGPWMKPVWLMSAMRPSMMTLLSSKTDSGSVSGAVTLSASLPFGWKRPPTMLVMSSARNTMTVMPR